MSVQASEVGVQSAQFPPVLEGARSNLLRIAAMSAVTVGSGLASAKIVAVHTGVSGVGRQSLIAGIGSIVTLVCDMNVGQAMIRSIALDSVEAQPGVISIRIRATRQITIIGSIIAIGATAWFAISLRSILGAAIASGAVWGAAGGAMAMMATQETNVLTAFHRVRRRTWATGLHALLTPLVTLACLQRYPVGGLGGAYLATSVVGFVIFAAASRSSVRNVSSGAKPDRASVRRERATLLTFGRSMTLAVLAGNGVVLLLPFIAERLLGIEAAGLFRVATVASLGYTAMFNVALSSDFFPRACALTSSPERFRQVVDDQLQLMLMTFAPVAALGTTFSRQFVTIAYSSAFGGASGLVDRQIVADVLRLACWTVCFAVLAAGGSRALLQVEAIAGATLLTSTILLAKLSGMQGLGTAQLVGYTVTAFVVVRKLRALTGWSPSARVGRSLAACLASAGLPLLFRHLAPGTAGMVAGTVVASVALILAIRTLAPTKFAAVASIRRIRAAESDPEGHGPDGQRRHG